MQVRCSALGSAMADRNPDKRPPVKAPAVRKRNLLALKGQWVRHWPLQALQASHASSAEDTEDWMLQQALAAAMKGMSKDDEIPGLHSSSSNALPESVAPPVAAAPRATP